MAAENRITQFIIETQIAIFTDARRELQLPLKAIACDSGIPYPTLVAYAEGRNALSLAAVKRLLAIKGFGPYLSRLFEPEDFALVGAGQQTDHDDFAEKCVELVKQTAAAHRPDSECAEKIGPGESARLRRARIVLKSVA